MSEININNDSIDEKATTSKKICGCGHSETLPYCDGGHKNRTKVFNINLTMPVKKAN